MPKYQGPAEQDWTKKDVKRFRKTGEEPQDVVGLSWGNLVEKLLTPEGAMTAAGAVINPLLPIAFGSGGAGNSGYTRFREKEVDEALIQNLVNRNALQSQSPEATRLAKANNLQMGRGNAVNAAANMGASAAANSGLGGDMNSALIQGIQSAAPVMQASQGYDQALSNAYTERTSEQLALNDQIGKNTMDRAVMADMTTYAATLGSGGADKVLPNLLDYVLGGASKGNSIYDFIKNNKATVTDKTK